jgi:prepilin-type N-terminal cleavage/methylation domain-containing protein
MTQGSLISSARRAHRSRAFTLVEIMVVVVIIGLLAAMSLPAYRRITMRSRTATLVSDLRSYSTAFITYSLQNGKWPLSGSPQEIPTEMVGALSLGFSGKSPIGGVYKWNYDSAGLGAADGKDAKAAIIIETSGGEIQTDDAELLEMIDREMDDGNLATGSIQLGDTHSLVYIIEK